MVFGVHRSHYAYFPSTIDKEGLLNRFSCFCCVAFQYYHFMVIFFVTTFICYFFLILTCPFLLL